MSCCGEYRATRRLSVKEIEDHAFLPHILDGYPCVNTINECLYSLFWIHNETVNVWSHLIGLGVMVWLFVCKGMEMHQHHFADTIVLSTFFVCACACFLLSAIYHLFKLHSYSVYRVVVTLDYMGIFVMIFGSFISGLHFEFYCHSTERTIYQAGISSMCVAGMVLTFTPYFNDVKYDNLRVASYFGTVAFAVFPMAHAVISFGSHKLVKWMILLGLYAAGAVFYITKFPESKYPGKFDIWFSSHQLWHTFVVLAALWHYYAISTLHEEVQQEGFCETMDKIFESGFRVSGVEL